MSDDADQILAILHRLEGNLPGSIYSASQVSDGGEDILYQEIALILCPEAGRLPDDRVPTGVAVTSVMNHGGPFPATGHPGFTAAGFPVAIWRFSMLACYDNLREQRHQELPRDENPEGGPLRLIDGEWLRK